MQGGNDLVWRVLAQGFGNVEKIDELTTNFDSLIDSMLTNLPLVNVTP
ncbi:hypothetical protein TUM4641_35270 [Shewanella morhuae]|nr:hypothetical protein TUM4641_35270 [Shewanella morhuae]